MPLAYTRIRVLTALLIVSSTLISACSKRVVTEEIRVAVASNFSDTLKVLAKNFQTETGHKVTIIPGSTGKLYAQINHGAPFDAFFSADVKRARLLEQNNLALSGSRFTYAIGKIILWSPDTGFIDNEADTLKHKAFQHLAIANPKLAPYGKAAQQVLQAIGIWGQLPGRLVQGENIAQTYQFVQTGNAELGFVALSQVKKPGQAIQGSFWLVPQSLYTPVEQQAVLLKDKAAARQFMAYVQNEAAVQVIQSFGYAVHAGSDQDGSDHAQ